MVNSIMSGSGNMFRTNSTYLANQAQKSTFKIQRNCRNIADIPPQCKLHLYQSLVQPILTYGSEIWGHDSNSNKALDKTFHRYLRYVLKVKMSTSIKILEGECGAIPPSVKCHISCLLYFIRLNTIPEGSVLKNAFNESMYLSKLGFKCWVSRVCELARSYNLDIESFTYNDQTKIHIKELIKSKYIEEWKNSLIRIDTNPLLRTYALFKFDFKLEPYLYQIKNRKYRNYFARFRASSHTLEIEKGRHTNPKTPIEKRICKSCLVLEDELHFLINCTLYNECRIELFRNISDNYPSFTGWSDEEKFIFLLSYNDSQVLTLTAKFIHHCFLKRNQLFPK